MVLGTVYLPLASMAPPAAPSCTLQVTPLLVEPVTVAVKIWTPPTARVAVVGETLRPTGVVIGLLPPPPQPVRRNRKTGITIQSMRCTIASFVVSKLYVGEGADAECVKNRETNRLTLVSCCEPASTCEVVSAACV